MAERTLGEWISAAVLILDHDPEYLARLRLKDREPRLDLMLTVWNGKDTV